MFARPSINFMLYGALKNLSLEKVKILGNAFIDCQLNYVPLIWMFCRKTFCSKIEKLHHRTLKVIYGIDDSYNNLLLRSNYVSIHQRHLRFLVTDIFKNLSEINPKFMWSFFKQKKLSYNLRKGPTPHLPRTQSTYCGTNVEVLLYAKIKSSNSVFQLKTKIKNLENIDCECLICR